MDFYQIKERPGIKKDTLDVYADFKVIRSKDLMVRSKSFYAIWDEEKGLWSTDEYDVVRLVDSDIEKHEIYTPGLFEVQRKYLGNFGSNSWLQFRNYVGHLSDSSYQLDETLTFSNTEVKKSDHVSKKLPYPLEAGNHESWDELIDTLYDPVERAKIEWVIGAIVAGDSKFIQKFLVFYGPGGTGKSTVLEIIQKLFEGYWVTFEASAITGNNNSFSTEVFKGNPLVAIQHDGDLSNIKDNSKLNAIVAHEMMTMNEKYKPSYDARVNAFLIMGTNKPVKITDAKSGLIRRLLDVHPTGNLIPPRKYQALMSKMNFELGAIAAHCLEVYRSMGKDYYAGYKPLEMMLQTDIFFNYIEAYYDVFREKDGVTLFQAYTLFKEYCKESNIERVMPRYQFREELRNYFDTFEERAEIDGLRVRSWYGGFKADRFKVVVKEDPQPVFSLVIDDTESLFDNLMADQPAQYSKDDGSPTKYWDGSVRDKNGKEYTPKPSEIVSTTLKDLDTTKEHYVKVPENHIIIDFDLKDKDGKKSSERNLEAASSWPSTYAEFSKSGDGIHLHYNYEGDPGELARVYEDGIEVKVYTGNSSLRRRLSRCNNVPVASLTAGYLPLREKKVINEQSVKSEKSLRELIKKNLRKEIHPGTKSSMDFIYKILDDAYKSDLTYDVTDMRNEILAFGNNSTNHALYCIKLVQQMKFQSEDFVEKSQAAAAELEKKPSRQISEHVSECQCEDCQAKTDNREVFFDVEVFPNLFVICWKYKDSPNVVRMINPKPNEVEPLLAMKLVGFNCRRYDNHILYAAFMGYSNEKLYNLSQKIINGTPSAMFGEAYNISYTDIYDFSSIKQSLKKWEIELGIKHLELGLPWDQPVPEELWEKVAEYCDNDVIATEAVFNHLNGDYIARQILADLSGLPMNATTQQHASKIVFGDDSRPQSKFVYTDLATGNLYEDLDNRAPTGKTDISFPGYTFDLGKSMYRGEDPKEGGYVYAEPGVYTDVVLLDVESMHPTSIEALNLFGDAYTKNFSDLKSARVAIKNNDYDAAKEMLGGKLARHLKDPSNSEDLSYALKIVINIVYGLTSAKFDNAFRDPRNMDNIVAKRGALFMIDLKHAVQEKGYTVAHIKTDSIKIPGATQEIIDFVMEFGKGYGYKFVHEATYEKMALVNDAVYIAKYGWAQKEKKIGKWEAVGAQFQVPYVFKKLFSKETIEFRDLCIAKSVQTALYLTFEEDKPMALGGDSEPVRRFVGKTGLFVPIKEGAGGGLLQREKDGKFYAATGTTGYFWLEAEVVDNLAKYDDVDYGYFEKQVTDAIETLKKHTEKAGLDWEWFIQ